MTNLLQRFIKKQSLEDATKVSKIDVFKKEIFVSPDKVDMRFAAKTGSRHCSKGEESKSSLGT